MTVTKIKLSNGQCALVDDADAPAVQQFRWHKGSRGHSSTGKEFPAPARHIHGTTQYLSDFIVGKRPGLDISYRDGDAFNCQRSNLRHGTRSQNWGGHCKRKNTYSRFKGVTWHKSKRVWFAKVQYRCVIYNLGLFLYENDAARAYNRRADEIFGEFARLNVVPAGRGRRRPAIR